jgi:hypothetical protein
LTTAFLPVSFFFTAFFTADFLLLTFFFTVFLAGFRETDFFAALLLLAFFNMENLLRILCPLVSLPKSQLIVTYAHDGAYPYYRTMFPIRALGDD